MIRYETFFRRFVVRRVGDLSTLTPLSDIDELPPGSVLHLIDNFNMDYEDKPPLVPNINNPLYKLTSEKKIVYPVKNYVSGHIPIIDKAIRILTIGVDKELRKFRQQNAPNVKLIDTVADFKDQMSIQNIVSYNSLFNVRITGRMQRYRMINNVLATTMNVAAMDLTRDHFIHIPLTGLSFEKPDFIRSFKEHTKVTIKHPEIPHYLFLMQLYSYIEAGSTASLFEELLPDALEKINFVLTYGDNAVIYRLDTLKELNGPGNNALLRIMYQINKLCFSGEGFVEEDTTPVAPEELTQVKLNPVGLNSTGFAKPRSEKELKEKAIENLTKIDQAAEIAIDNTPGITPKQKERAKVLAQSYKALEIDGVSVVDILTNSVSETIEGEELDFLDNELIDDSLKKSSLSSFNSEYVKKSAEKDIASTLVSFSSQGMFLTNVKKEDVSDEQSNLVEYTANFEDPTGKKHTIKFTIPKVDRNGLCKVNGQLKTLKLQRINVPIVKESATRVMLNSNFNKTLVERNTTVAHSFIHYFKKLLDKADSTLYGFEQGTFEYDTLPLPYEYSSLAKHYRTLWTGSISWNFDYEKRWSVRSPTHILQPQMEREQQYGVRIATAKPEGKSSGQKYEYYLSTTGDLTKWNIESNQVEYVTTIIDEVAEALKLKPKPLTEWCDFKVLAKKVTLAFALCYRFGLTHMLKYMNADYTLYEANERVKTKVSDIVIRFKDKKLVIKSTPKHVALIFAGLTKYKMLKNVYYEAMDEKDIYYDIIQAERMSTNYIKGIDSLFELFIDPITADVLDQMGEPTNMKDLLIRAVVLVTTEDHLPRASSSNFRYRSYERFSAMAYRKMARALATYQNGSVGATNKFSISPYEVLSEIMKDPLMNNVNTINPINDIKEFSGYSHSGEGGRAAEAMVIADRLYPEDAIGIISEATVDSGKVAIDGMLSADPTIINTRGMTETKPISELSPANILSATTLLIPSADQDDGKRANYINIQMSQYTPTKESNTSRIRTGFERVLPHRSRLPFAYAAEEDGVITDINEQAGTITIKYKKSEEVYVLEWGQQYTNNGGGGFHVTQNVVINDFKVNDKFKRGDILLYNKDFFASDPYSKQVDTKLGYHANVALVDAALTMEDGCIISRHLSNALTSNPVQVRTITIKSSTIVHQIAAEGSKVKSISPLIVFDDSDIPTEYDDNPELLDALKKLNRSTPKSKYDGTVVKIEAYYKSSPNEMSESLAKIVRSVSRKQNAKAKIASEATNNDEYPRKDVLQGDRLGQIDIEEDTVVLKFFIQQDLGMEGGDKIVFGGALKSVCSKVSEQRFMSEDEKTYVDAIMGASSVANRMVPSILIMGATNRILDKMEQDMLDMYFDD